MLLLFACRRTLESKVVSLLWIIPAWLFICTDKCAKITDLSAGSWSWSTAYTKMLSSPVWRCTKRLRKLLLSMHWCCFCSRGRVRSYGERRHCCCRTYVFSVARISPPAISDIYVFSLFIFFLSLHVAPVLLNFVLWWWRIIIFLVNL